MPKAQLSKDKFWAEMEALLVDEQPGPEWFTVADAIKKGIGIRSPHTTRKRLQAHVNAGTLESKVFLIGNIKTTHYRIKK